MSKDLTRRQYESAMKRHGFTARGFMGYWTLPAPFQDLSVCSLNAGDRRRDRLKFMLAHLDANKTGRARTIDIGGYKTTIRPASHKASE